MIKLYLILFMLIFVGCGGNSVNKPALLSSAESDVNEAMQAYIDEDWVSAQRLFNRALSQYQSMDDRLGALNSTINLVEVALARHDMMTARARLSLAENIVTIEGLDSYYPRMTLLNALLAIQQKQMTKANHLLSELLPIFNGVEMTVIPSIIQLVAISSRTTVAFEQKHNESLWTKRYRQAIKKSANKSITLDAGLLRFQAKLSLQQGGDDQAEAYLQKSLSIYKKTGSRTEIAGILFELGKLSKMQDKRERAVSYFKRSIIVYRSLGREDKVHEITKWLTEIKAAMMKQ